MSERGTKSTLMIAGLATPITLHRATSGAPKESKWDVERTENQPTSPAPSREALATVNGDRSRQSVVSTPTETRRRGVYREDGAFVDLTEQIAEIEERTKLDEVEIVGFVRRDAIPRSRYQGAYYVGLGDGGDPRLLRALYEAMSAESRVAVVRWTKSRKQALGLLGPAGGGVLRVIEVAWAEDLRDPPSRARAYADAPNSDEDREAARDLVRALSEGVGDSLATLRDEARVLREELLGAAREGRLERFAVPERPPRVEATEIAPALRSGAERAREAA